MDNEYDLTGQLDVDDSFFEDDESVEEEFEDVTDPEPSDQGPEPEIEPDTDTEEQEKKLFAQKYHSEDDLIKGYTNLVNAYTDKVQKLSEVSGDKSYLDTLNKIQKEFDTVEDVEAAYQELNRDFSRQSNALAVYKKQPQQAPQQHAPQQHAPQHRGEVIPPALANDPRFNQLLQTNPMDAVGQIVQYRVQEAVQQQQQQAQYQQMEYQQKQMLIEQTNRVKAMPDYDEVQEDVIGILEEMPFLAQQPDGIMKAYEFGKLKKLQRELSENALTADKIKIATKQSKQRASAPTGKSGGEPAKSVEDQIVDDIFNAGSGLGSFLT